MSLIGYKGFNKDLTCLGFQYQVGQTYTMQGSIELCARGFHFCQYPLDVLKYYNCSDHVYAKVLAEDHIIKDNTKCVTNRLTILELVTREQLVKAMPSHLVRKDGTQEWYREGLKHRIDGPAAEHANGIREWYMEDKLHRLDGPAIEYNSNKEWYVEDKRHRSDGPAIEYANGTREWYVEDKRHRSDGPAIERADGTKAWYVEGKRHRLDGPAIEYADGGKSWYVEDKCHRLDGPAVEGADGTKEWYVDNQRHRLDGPAIEWYYGTKEWYNNGLLYKRQLSDGTVINHNITTA